MGTPQQPTDHKEEQDALHLQEPPDIQLTDATRFAPKVPVSPPVAQQAHGTSPYYVREDDDSDGQDPGGVSSSFIAPFQLSTEMPVLNGDEDEVRQNISPPVSGKNPSGAKKHRPPLLTIALASIIALLVLGGLWATVFAQPAQPLATTKGATPSGIRQSSGGQIGSTAHAGPTATPVLKPTATMVPTNATAGPTQNGSWVPQHLPTGWTTAGLTMGDGIFAERTAMTFTDREMGLDFRNVGTRGQHGGTFTAATFILTPGGRERFAQNDVRAVNNVLFDKVAATQLVQAAVNATPNLVQFQVQGQQEFAWVDVSYTLFQSKIDPNATSQQRAEGLEMDPVTAQPRVHGP